MTIGIGILGAEGRMGRMLVAEVLATAGARLTGGTVSDPSKAGRSLTPDGVATTSDGAALAAASAVLIDFSSPGAAARHAALAAAAGAALVIGTTGLDAAAEAALDQAARVVPVVVSANMSLGVNLLLGLVERVARALGPEAFDIEILEMHHRHKVDAPSGTALALGQAAARGRSQPLGELAVRTRDGHTGPRPTGAIGFATLRGGDVVGDHRVIFAGSGERIELAHLATDRRIFARGAVHAALWAVGQPPGRYGMADVLGL